MSNDVSNMDTRQDAPVTEEAVQEQTAPETEQAAGTAAPETPEAAAESPETPETPEAPETPEPQKAPESAPEAAAPARDSLREALARKEDQYLRLAAEYDNYRKRTAKEKEKLGQSIRADTAAAFLPVYDNLERALKQETADEAFKKGVEMTMNQLKEVFLKLNITEIPALGKPFDPNLHNAVMHVEDDSVGENTVVEVFQAGFQCGDRVVRCSMVKVAN